MADLTALHKSARTLILSLRDGMEQLERAETVSGLNNPCWRPGAKVPLEER